MKIFIDESGQTGCITLSRNNKLSFLQQPTFVNGCVCAKTEDDEKSLIKKYLEFKKMFNFNGEIKGTDLLTRENNEALDYFINNILNSNNFIINFYDKKFYIASLIGMSVCGTFARYTHTELYYSCISSLSFQDDDFFIEYLNFIENINVENLEKYLIFLKNYSYKYIPYEQNMVANIASIILDRKELNLFVNDFMCKGWYEDSTKVNVINLNSLSEIIMFIKEKFDISNSEYLVYHDHIDEFEELIKLELAAFNVNIQFEESDGNILMEIADNISSIFAHAFNKVKNTRFQKCMFDENNSWNCNLLSKIIDKIGKSNIKYTIPIPDWAAILSVTDIFATTNADNKNLFTFNYYYQMYSIQIFEELSSINSSDAEEFDKIKK